ncbi:MAG: methionyl-tRNA formyltransferase, partial [Gaiellales bacterium]
ADPSLEVALVLTQPDRRAGRGRALRRPPVADRALELGLAVLQPERPPEALDELRSAGLGSIAVVAYGELVPRALLDELPWLNLHPSRLPRWRGAAPIERALMAGEDELASCVILLVEALDAGPIAGCERFELGWDEDAVDAYRRSLELGAPLLARALVDAAEGRLATVPQIGEASYAAKLGKDDLALDPNDPWRAAHDRVRALAATTGARLAIDGSLLTIWRSRPAPDAERIAAGALLVADDRVLLGVADGALELVDVQPSGRRRMAAADWARGLRGELPIAARP